MSTEESKNKTETENDSEKPSAIIISGCYQAPSMYLAISLNFQLDKNTETLNESNVPELDLVSNEDCHFILSQTTNKNSDIIKNLEFEFEFVESSLRITRYKLPNVSFEKEIAFNFDSDKLYDLKLNLEELQTKCFFESLESKNVKIVLSLKFSADFVTFPDAELSAYDYDLQTVSFQELLSDNLFCCNHNSEKHSQEMLSHYNDNTGDEDYIREITHAEHLSLILDTEFSLQEFLFENRDGLSHIYLDFKQRNFLTFHEEFNFNSEPEKEINFKSNLYFERKNLIYLPERTVDYEQISTLRSSFFVDWWFYDTKFQDIITKQDRICDGLHHKFGQLNFPHESKSSFILPAYRFDSRSVPSCDTLKQFDDDFQKLLISVENDSKDD